MIKANELRIGNWVLVCGVEIVIFSMAPTTNGRTWGFNLFDGEMPSFYDYECEPIPLTPEILERCGFEKKNEDGVETFTFQINGISDHGDNRYELFGIKSKKDSIQIDYDSKQILGSTACTVFTSASKPLLCINRRRT